MPRVKIKKLKGFFKKVPKVFGEHAFLIFLFLFFLSLFGGYLFYKHSTLALRREPKITIETVQFKENIYQKILAEWRARTETFDAAELKEYPDPFRK